MTGFLKKISGGRKIASIAFRFNFEKNLKHSPARVDIKLINSMEALTSDFSASIFPAVKILRMFYDNLPDADDAPFQKVVSCLNYLFSCLPYQ